MRTFFPRFSFAAITTIFLILASCAVVKDPAMYADLAIGQYEIFSAKRPIEKVIADSSVPTETRSGLQKIALMKKFARERLHLAETDSYSTYVDTGREFANSSLTAAPEFSTLPKLWSFPLKGRVTHLTFFRKSLAEKYADELRGLGYETYLRGVRAYSTDGFFADPVLNTFLHADEIYVAGSIFHEMTHETVRAKSDGAFTESLAQFVENEGQKLWILETQGKEAFDAYLENVARERSLNILVAESKAELEALYRKNLPQDEARTQKLLIYSDMRVKYEILKASWKGDARYDRWMTSGWNNARMAAHAVYNDHTGAFAIMFQRCKNDFGIFMREAKRIAILPQEERNDYMNALSEK